MKFKCQTRELLDAISLVSGVVPGNPTRPILQSSKIHATKNGLQIIGTDLEVGLQVQVDDVVVGKEGTCLVPCARLVAILRELQDPELVFKVDAAGRACVSAGTAHFKLPAGPVEEFPSVEFSSSGPAIQISRKELLQALHRVSVAAARDATRFNMHSVLFDGRGEEMRIVSTDGKRMALSTISVAAGGDGGLPEGQFILPLKGVDLLSKILSTETEEQVIVHLDQNEVTYISDRVSLTCRLVEGKFPEYERAVPKKFGCVFVINTDDLLVSLRQAALMTTKETNSVRFAFDSNTATISSSASNVGESRIVFPVEKTHGEEEEFVVHFNPGYLIELLKVIGTSKIQCGFTDGKTAGLFTIPDDETAYQHIVMPLVVNEMQEA
jgi:DNA polymerase-3 subunit beta